MERQSFQLERRSRLRESYRQKYYETDGQNPLGNYHLLMTDYHMGEAFLTIGPNYIVFAISFIIVNLITVWLLLKLNKHEQQKTFFLILTVAIIFFDIVWLATAFINPGIATPSPDDEGEICEICQADNGIDVTKKQGRYHCPDCNICIDEYETHIKMIGGCVGKNNFIVFKLVLLGIFVWGLSMITIVPQTRYT